MTTTARDLAREVLAAEMAPEVLEAADAAEDTGRALGWYFDPQHDDVVGLISTDEYALVVVYLAARDAEVSAELFDGMVA